MYHRQMARLSLTRAVCCAAIVEIPYLISQMCVFMPISYFMIGFELSASKFFFYALVFLLNLTTFTLFGQLLVFLTPNVAVAQILGSSTPFLLLSLLVQALLVVRADCHLGTARSAQESHKASVTVCSSAHVQSVLATLQAACCHSEALRCDSGQMASRTGLFRMLLPAATTATL